MLDPQRLTPEQLAEIRERCEAATPPPWNVEPYVDAIDIVDQHDQLVMMAADRELSAAGMPPENARFTAHARQDIPDLLAEIDALQRERDQWRDRATLAPQDGDRFGFNQTVDPE